MFDERISILSNARINNSYWKLTFKSSKIASKAKPGQFINLRIENSYDPFLRRPFSIYRVHSGSKIDLLYDVVGKGTKILSTLKPGSEVNVLGPLGSSFSKPKKDEFSILVGGGIGVAPMIYWNEVYKAKYLIMGYRDKTQMLPDGEFKGKVKKFVSTNDGSVGKKGFVTDVLEDVLENLMDKGDLRKVKIYTCGPTVMMNAVREIAAWYEVSGELSVEEKMACGVGACLGCVVKTKEGNKTSCKCGPVFKFDEFE